VSSSLCLMAQRPSHWLADSGATHMTIWCVASLCCVVHI
jgi:hypothetical protein